MACAKQSALLTFVSKVSLKTSRFGREILSWWLSKTAALCSKNKIGISENATTFYALAVQNLNFRSAPSIYCPEIIEEILWRLGSGQTLRNICSLNHMPDVTTIFAWEQKYPEFTKLSTRARG